MTISLTFMLGDTTDAFAAAQLRITADDTVNAPVVVTIVDDGPGDVCAPGVLGCIIFNVIPIGPLGCVLISGETAVTKPFQGGVMLPTMDLAYSVTTEGLCHVKIEFTDTDFTAGKVLITTDIGGTTQGTTHYSANFDPANQPFGAFGNIFNLQHIAPPAGFVGMGANLLTPNGDYSLTLDVEVWHGEGTLTSSGDAFLIGSPPVEGTLMPIDTSALYLAGLGSVTMWMIPAVAGMAGVAMYVVKFRKQN